MTHCLSVKENENIKPSVTRAGRSVLKDSDGWNKGKSREKPAQARVWEVPHRMQCGEEKRWGGFQELWGLKLPSEASFYTSSYPRPA